MILLLSAALLAVGACNRADAPSSSAEVANAEPIGSRAALFQDMTPGARVDFTYRNGQEAGHYAILESLGGGVALLDFDGELLGQQLAVEFWSRLRDEIPFDSVEALARQIGEDVERTRQLVPDERGG